MHHALPRAVHRAVSRLHQAQAHLRLLELVALHQVSPGRQQQRPHPQPGRLLVPRPRVHVHRQLPGAHLQPVPLAVGLGARPQWQRRPEGEARRSPAHLVRHGQLRHAHVHRHLVLLRRHRQPRLVLRHQPRANLGRLVLRQARQRDAVAQHGRQEGRRLAHRQRLGQLRGPYLGLRRTLARRLAAGRHQHPGLHRRLPHQELRRRLLAGRGHHAHHGTHLQRRHLAPQGALHRRRRQSAAHVVRALEHGARAGTAAAHGAHVRRRHRAPHQRAHAVVRAAQQLRRRRPRAALQQIG
mmetsp:Transcript_27762/g.89391  ORF Transcript_27762/g.89391 Transcript_27762/m.89391 type:complete len:297 (-) Transcript_27762:5653-6543(-)